MKRSKIVVIYLAKSFTERLETSEFLHGLFQVGSIGGGGHKVPASLFSEMLKTIANKFGTLTN